jgi:hypothetical protein
VPFTTATFVAYGNGLWIAFGSLGQISTSPDLVTWSTRTTPFTLITNGAFWNGSLWIAVNTGTGNSMARSTDGTAWTGMGKTTFTSVGQSVTYANGLWVAGGQGGNSIAKSTDGGNTWSGVSTNGGISIGRYVTYANGIWVAVGEGAGNTLVTSSDGTNWTGFPPANNGNINIGNSVAYGNGRWIAVGSAGTSPRISYSDDNGISWTAGTSYGGLNQDIRDVKYANGIWVAVGYGTGGGVTSGISVDVIAKQYEIEARIAHRLDRETSGIMIIAKNKYMARHVTQLFAQNLVKKKYYAMVEKITQESGTIITNIHKDTHLQKMVATEGKNCVTKFSSVNENILFNLDFLANFIPAFITLPLLPLATFLAR